MNAKNNKVEFLGFDIKIPEIENRAVDENRKILSFKKIKNRLVRRRSAMKSRFEKVMFQFYEAQKLKFLKVLLTGKKDKVFQKKVIHLLALKDALELQDGVNVEKSICKSEKELFEN